ncbi:MAG TPA: UBP-type zinc finger domain-containing protein [Gammaproteobacteria bacterium]|nr:UBP-type zinc finger domain-containing protein [Gammaproteobacteria bacterium]
MPSVKLTAQQLHSKLCKHTGQAREVSYTAHVCPECVAQDDTWVHLRICMICGHVGCCDSSRNRHARAHYASSQHPIIKTIEAEPDWAWCYPDDTYLK